MTPFQRCRPSGAQLTKFSAGRKMKTRPSQKNLNSWVRTTFTVAGLYIAIGPVPRDTMEPSDRPVNQSLANTPGAAVARLSYVSTEHTIKAR